VQGPTLFSIDAVGNHTHTFTTASVASHAHAGSTASTNVTVNNNAGSERRPASAVALACIRY